MPFRIRKRFFGSESSESFNMTAVIDIVFLLIIFFLVVCRFIEAENFPVAVPDECEFAMEDIEDRSLVTTVTVMKTSEEEIEFAVDSEKVIATKGGFEVVNRIAELVDERLRSLPAGDRVVTLRIDKSVCFADAQYALAGVTESMATEVKLAALKDRDISQ